MSYKPNLISFSNKVVTFGNTGLGWSSYIPDVYNLHLNQNVGGTIGADTPTAHSQTFTNCGSNTVNGAAELAQIPSIWK